MFRIVALLFVISVSSAVAQADPVTGGFYRFGGSFSSLTERMSFGGPGYGVSGLASTQFGISLPAMFTCFPCATGTSVNLSSSAFLVAGDFAFGTITVNGISRSLATSSMGFSAGTVIVPVTTDPFVTLSAPFTLTNGGASGGGIGVGGLTGSGTAFLSLDFVGTDAAGNRLYRFNELTYIFNSGIAPVPEPVPEPASMLLLLSGVLALPGVLRKRKGRA